MSRCGEKSSYLDKREYLQQACFIDKKIEAISDSLMRCHNECQNIKNRHLDEIKVQTSLNVSALEDEVIRMVDNERRLNEELEKTISLKNEIYQAINDVADNEARTCLRWIYIDNKSIKEYAETFCYSVKTAYRRRDTAIEMIRLP